MKMWGKVAFVGIVATACALPLMAGEGQGAGKAEKLDQKIEARKDKVEARHEKIEAKVTKHHEDNMAILKEKLAKAKRLTDAEKEEIMNFFEQQFDENVSFRDGQFTENLAFLDELAGQEGLTKEQFKEKIKAHIATQKSENKEHRAVQKTERKAEREKIKAEKKDGKAAE